MLIVRRFAANYRAEAKHGSVIARVGHPLRSKRDFERPRHPGNVNRIIGDAVLCKRCHGAIE
jgi:hypothetical protein